MKKRIYLIAVLLWFLAIEAFLLFAKRSEASELERRKLNTFPELTADAYWSGAYTEGISNWFSDTVPMRDTLMEQAMTLMNAKGLAGGGVVFVGVGTEAAPVEEVQETEPAPAEAPPGIHSVADVWAPYDALVSEHDRQIAEEEAAKAHRNERIERDFNGVVDDQYILAKNGIIVTGSGAQTRAMMLYGGNRDVAVSYAQMVNHYKEVMPEVNVYCMPIPTSIAYYCPAEALRYTGSQVDRINDMMETFSDDVVGVDIYSVLGEHTAEPIYSRTDHHWAPLGAFYAAQKFAEEADVPFMELSEYEEKHINNYVGTMYMWSKSQQVKDNPETFVYYEPTSLEYRTVYIDYVTENGMPVREEAPHDGKFFMKYPDGHSDAYCTFMGSDERITQVYTSTQNGRKLLVIKDSFGNAVPGYLFGSFQEVHVIDYRYFLRNVVEYVTEYGITDILFAHNVSHATTPYIVTCCERFLTR